MSKLIIVRGLPGSGREALADTLYNGLHVAYKAPRCFGPDDFFHLREGEVPLREAHLHEPSLIHAGDYPDREGRTALRALNLSESFSWNYRPELLPHATRWASDSVRDIFAASSSAGVVLYGAFPEDRDLLPYLKAAGRARVRVVDLFDGGKSDTILSQESGSSLPYLARLRARWTHDWVKDSTPPDEGVFHRPLPGN